MKTFALLVILSVFCASLSAEPPAARLAASERSTPLPQRLSDTGFTRGAVTRCVRTTASPVSVWSDGTSKRRWIYLPPATAVDASLVDAWEFPVGTRLWKEFSYDRRVETRFIERLADGSWRFAAYVWNQEGTDAVLAAEDGAVLPVSAAPGGRYVVPSRTDCLACHEGAPVPVLGFSALQLSPDRDPLAPHAEPARNYHANLSNLAASKRLRNLPRRHVVQPPRIAAASPTERAALGYLHGNCGHCHNDDGALAGVELVLAQQSMPPHKAPSKRCSHCSATRAASVRKALPAHNGSHAMAARTC
jgi:hypothetical protein